MARKPKAASRAEFATSIEEDLPTLGNATPPARRGRKPKTAEPIEFAASTIGDTEDAETVEAEAATIAPIQKPARGKPGPKPKRRPEAAAPVSPDADEQRPAMDLDQPDAALEQTLGQDDAMIAEMADLVSTDDNGAPAFSDAGVDDAMPAASQDGAGSAKPAAQWDRTADTVQFDWPEIERTAAQDGPNQVIAKLLVAARAQGANSRWPL